MTGIRVRSAYRALLRAQRITFRGDVEMISATQRALRSEFDKGSTAVTTGEAKLEDRLREADETVDFLLKNVVQAPLNTRGNYEVGASQIRSDK